MDQAENRDGHALDGDALASLLESSTGCTLDHYIGHALAPAGNVSPLVEVGWARALGQVPGSFWRALHLPTHMCA